MNLGQLKTLLESQPMDRVCYYGFGEPMSYRGYYDQVAFAPETNVTIQTMLKYVDQALSDVFTGYKGGSYVYDARTPVNIAEYGEYNSEEDEYFDGKILQSILGID